LTQINAQIGRRAFFGGRVVFIRSIPSARSVRPTGVMGIETCLNEASMDRKTKAFILKQMKDHDTMTVATVRKDGWPQATTVVYANDGLALYFVCDRDSQKLHNIERCNKVSVTIDGEEQDWSKLRGLSLAATAKRLKKDADIAGALRLLARKFPELADLSAPERSELAVVKLSPKVISVIDYRKGFGHADLVRA
jgi:nitroimidazol reductase NimA-like FMN-containing flavoprotein (pyridoxamine 5'-phosphate oxidase superfamily)